MAVVGDGGGDEEEEWRGILYYVVELLYYCIGYVVEGTVLGSYA